MVNKGGFSLLRLIGITRLKGKISRKTGIPWTKQGRKAKFSLWRW